MARISRKAIILGQTAEMQIQTSMYNVAAYVRLSVEDGSSEKHPESIAMQRYLLEAYIEKQPDMKLYQVYCDSGESGTNFERPAFIRMMEDVRKQKVNCIVVKDLSRFGRNYVETGYYLETILPSLKVRFVALNDQYDSQKGECGEELVFSLKNLINDLYAKDISQEIHSALSIKQKKGDFIGSLAPYGYQRSMEDKHKLEVDPEAALVVQEIFKKRYAGESFLQIAKWLDNRGIPSPSFYQYQKGHKKIKPTASVWRAQTIKHIISNPVYLGHMAQGRTKKSLCDGISKTKISREGWIVVKNTHKALISQEVFDQVQTIRNKDNYQFL